MNKLDLIQALRDATDLTKQEAKKVVTVFFNDMAAALAKGERVEILELIIEKGQGSIEQNYGILKDPDNS